MSGVTLDEMKVVVRAELDQALAKLGMLDKSLETAKTKAQNLGDTMTKIGQKMSMGLTLPLVAAGGAAVKFAMDAERVKVSLGVMLGSVDKANKVFQEWRKFADSTPFSFEDISKAGKQLIAFGSDSSKVTGELKMLGDIAAGVDMDIGELAGIFGKMRTQQTLYAEEINQLAGRGLPVYRMLSEELGVAEKDVKKLASEGKISFSTLEAGIKKITSEGGQFAGMMDKLAQTGAGKLSTALDAVKGAAGKLGEVMLPIVKDILDGVTEFASGFAKLDKGTQQLIVTLAGVAAGAGPVMMAVGNITKGVDGLGKALNFVKANPVWLAIAGGIAVVSGIGGALDKLFVNAAERAEAFGNEMDQLNDKYQQAQSALSGLNSEEKLSQEKVNELTKLYPKLAEKVDLYKASVGQVTEAVKQLNLEEAKRTAGGYMASVSNLKAEHAGALSSGRAEVQAAYATIRASQQFIDRLPEAQKKAIRDAIKEAEKDKSFSSDEFRKIADMLIGTGNQNLYSAGSGIHSSAYAMDKWVETANEIEKTFNRVVQDLQNNLPSNMVYNKVTGEITYAQPSASSGAGMLAGSGGGPVGSGTPTYDYQLFDPYLTGILKTATRDMVETITEEFDAGAAEWAAANGGEFGPRNAPLMSEFIGAIEQGLSEAEINIDGSDFHSAWGTQGPGAQLGQLPGGPLAIGAHGVPQEVSIQPDDIGGIVSGIQDGLKVATQLVTGDFVGAFTTAAPALGKAIGGPVGGPVGEAVGQTVAAIVGFIQAIVEREEQVQNSMEQTNSDIDAFNEHMQSYIDEDLEIQREQLDAMQASLKIAQDSLDEIRKQKATELSVLQDQWERGMITTDQYTAGVSTINSQVSAAENVVSTAQAEITAQQTANDDANRLRDAKKDASNALESAIASAKARFEQLYESLDTYNPSFNAWNIFSGTSGPDEQLYNKIKDAEGLRGRIDSATSLRDLENIQIPKFAKGGIMETSGPQLFLAGDNPGGRERITVEPLSSGGYSSGVTIQINAPVYGVDDLYQKLNAAGRELVRQGRV